MKKTVLILAVAIVFLLAGASILYGILSQDMEPEQITAEGSMSSDASGSPEDADRTKAPDFTVYNEGGDAVRLSDYAGSPVVLNFWASWCGPCKREMPDFDEAYGELGEDVQFLMVNMTYGQETMKSARAFIAEEGYSFPVLYDTEGEATMIYSVYSLPTTYFIDADGYVAGHANGAIDRDTLDQGIERIWGGAH